MTSINTLKLFYAPGACSVSPHIALCEAELPFDIVKVDLRAKTLPGGEDFNLVNPKGSVPALQLQDGQILTETAVMLQYIADLKPEANLFPEQGTFERYRAQEWLNFIAMELHRGLGIFFSPLATDELKEVSKARLQQRFATISHALEGKNYLLGDQFSVVDAYAFYTLRSWQHLAKVDLGNFPVLQAYFARLMERPFVKAALSAERSNA